ncbi:MAG: prephenate dehydrogenase/arogenate dehydrogenase family protein [Pseudomonadota bacterium]
MTRRIKKVAILGQGLIGSSITRAIYHRNLPLEVVITDASRKVCERLLELGLGRAKVVFSNAEAVKDADLVIVCVPVASFASIVAEIAPHLKSGAILSDVGSVKAAIVEQSLPHIPEGVDLVPAHPIAGTEFSGPDAGLPKLFAGRWCIVTPTENSDPEAVAAVEGFWESIGSKVEIMSAEEHDHTLAITSHLPHLSDFSIFHTARNHEEKTGTPVTQYSAGTFRDFTRVALSNPHMWRDIIMLNHKALSRAFEQFSLDMQNILKAAEEGDLQKLEELISESRKMRAANIDEQDFTRKKVKVTDSMPSEIVKPYSTD